MNPSPTQAFVDELVGRGVSLEAAPGGKLRYRPKDAMSAEDVAKLRAHKEEILQEFFSDDRRFISSPPSSSKQNPDNYGQSPGDGYGDGYGDGGGAPSPKPSFLRNAEGQASTLGLIARWGVFGYVSIHDPISGEWHDVPIKDAPGWAKWEAGKRKEVGKQGITRLLTRSEMEKIWRKEREAPEEELPEGHKRGLVYED